MRRLLISLALVVLVAPAGAFAGGWATAGLGPPDDGLGAGDTWNAEVKVLQHGVTPLTGAHPAVTIRNASTGQAKTFDARPTDEPGVYVAKVVFPSKGKWSYEVYDGFTHGGAQTHKFTTIDIGTGGGGSLPFFAIIGVGTLALGAVAVIYLLARRVRVRAPAPSH
jgi:YtkA-like